MFKLQTTDEETPNEYQLMQENLQLKKKFAEAQKENDFLKKSSGILCEENRLVAYRFISKYRDRFGLRWLLRRMGIHVNAYYNYLKNHKSKYLIQKNKAHTEIKKIYHETGGILGHRISKCR